MKFLIILCIWIGAVAAILPIGLTINKKLLTINKNIIAQPAPIIIRPPTIVKVATPVVVESSPVIVKTPVIVKETEPVAEIVEEIKTDESHHETEIETAEVIPEKIVVETPTAEVIESVATVAVAPKTIYKTYTNVAAVPVYRKTISATIPITTIKRTPTILRTYSAIQRPIVVKRVYKQPATIYRSW